MDDNPEIRDRLNVNKSTYHNKRPRERFICFIRGAKWMKINQLNGPSPIHDTSTWLSQSIQSITHVCYWLGMQKNLPWKCFRTAFGHYDFRSTSASQKDWRMRKRYHLLLRSRIHPQSSRENFVVLERLYWGRIAVVLAWCTQKWIMTTKSCWYDREARNREKWRSKWNNLSFWFRSKEFFFLSWYS